jgi:hypothetical protein
MIIINGGGSDHEVLAVGAGYWLWLSSIALIWVAALIRFVPEIVAGVKRLRSS